MANVNLIGLPVILCPLCYVPLEVGYQGSVLVARHPFTMQGIPPCANDGKGYRVTAVAMSAQAIVPSQGQQ